MQPFDGVEGPYQPTYLESLVARPNERFGVTNSDQLKGRDRKIKIAAMIIIFSTLMILAGVHGCLMNSSFGNFFGLTMGAIGLSFGIKELVIQSLNRGREKKELEAALLDEKIKEGPDTCYTMKDFFAEQQRAVQSLGDRIKQLF